jgi:pimeloyl-ACP methyl ester carboxylesterase
VVSFEKMGSSDQMLRVAAADCRFSAKLIHPPGFEREDLRPHLIFLHEGLGCITLWRDFPETLCRSTGCPGFVYDRKGYGTSKPFEDDWPADYLHKEALQYLPALLRAAGITETVLIGHSDGGSIALIAASTGDQSITGVITEAAHIFVEEVTLSGIRKAVKDFETGGLKEKLARYHKGHTEAVFYRWAKRWLAAEFSDWNIEKCLQGITCPVLALQGEEDEYGTPAQIEGIADLVSGPVDAVLIPECGHIPHLQARKRVLQEMTQFITKLPEASGRVSKWI